MEVELIIPSIPDEILAAAKRVLAKTNPQEPTAQTSAGPTQIEAIEDARICASHLLDLAERLRTAQTAATRIFSAPQFQSTVEGDDRSGELNFGQPIPPSVFEN